MTPVKKTTSEGGTPVSDAAAGVVAAGGVVTPKPRGRKPKAVVVKPEAVHAAVAAVEATPVDISAVASEAQPVAEKSHARGKSYFAIGRRKSAVAHVKLMPGKGEMTVNKIEFNKYFPTNELQSAALAALKATNQLSGVGFMAKIAGGGKQGQADSLRHALARALIQMAPGYRLVVKKLGFLTRDSRVKERKKPGLKRARRAPQWQKR
ncbi:30S ribosomal protein S9 [Candidatus Uhrbacteria bacterium]|nr:30S ribosomal protein S9 [Candidatus Uhrbacteria bacterium]